MFRYVNPNLTYCVDDNKKYKFISQLEPYIKDCNYICLNYYNQRLIKENNICVDNCSNYENYFYEYNNTCYKECPNDTYNSSSNLCQKYYIYNNSEYYKDLPEGYYIIDNNLNNIDKCDIKCRNCTKESMQYNLCIECNNNKLF